RVARRLCRLPRRDRRDVPQDCRPCRKEVTTTGDNMLFLVISTPRPERPTTLIGQRNRYWTWMQPLLDSGTCRSVHARAGRGAVALFDVDSNATLHKLMN